MKRSFNSQNIPRPPLSKELPATFNYLDIEIGCGVGFHPIQYAQTHTDRLLVAIEKTTEKYKKFERRYRNHGEPSNLVPIHGNAVAWIAHFVKPETVDQYFILYPNPYPKNPQKRFFSMSFMGYLLTTLKKNGLITLATNEQFYFQEALSFALNTWKLDIIEKKILSKESIPRTHFEKKYLQRNETCYNAIFQKK